MKVILSFSAASDCDVDIDWGDGTAETCTSANGAQHTFSSGKGDINGIIYISEAPLDGIYINEVESGNYQRILTSVIVGKYPTLETFSLLFCQNVTLLDLSKTENLKRLQCWGTKISSLKLNKECTFSNGITYVNNGTESMDLTPYPNLTMFLLSEGGIKSLDISGLTKMDWGADTPYIVNSGYEFGYSYGLGNLSYIRCVNVSSSAYSTLIGKGASTGTLVTDNSSASASLRTSFENRGWTVIIE